MIEINPNGHKGIIIANTEGYCIFFEESHWLKLTPTERQEKILWALSRIDPA